MNEPIINIRGEKIALGPLRRDLIPLFLRWMNDFEVTRTITLGNRPMTEEAENAWYEKVSAPEVRNFTLYDLEGLVPVGVAGIFDINLVDRCCELGIVIGDKTRWGKGFATEAARLCAGYAFRALSLHNVMLRVQADNVAAVRAYTKAGFKEIGRRRGVVWQAGKPTDMIYMDVIAPEFPLRDAAK